MRRILIILISALFFCPAAAMAAEGTTPGLGQSLFESSELGSKQRSCKDCHAQGKGLDKTGDFNDEELKDIINACIRDALGGTLIDLDSREMNALLGYVKTFQKK